MGAYQCWLSQRERLRESLQNAVDTNGATFAARHAIAQVEQNTMAEQTDDLLRQQTGILFSCVKTSLNLLDISITTKVWVAQAQEENPKKKFALLALLTALVCAAVAGFYGYLKNLPLVWFPVALAVVAVITLYFAQNRRQSRSIPADDKFKVTAKPDAEKLFQAIDAQMKAIDRYMNDFSYLNEQCAVQNNAQELKNVNVLADLMQAVYDCKGEAGEDAVAAAERLLQCLGVRTATYRAEDYRLFTVLPSLSATHTIMPALVSVKDGALLYRGTAAVVSDNPAPEQVMQPAASVPETLAAAQSASNPADSFAQPGGQA